MVEIHYYFSVLSPFTYLAGDGLERIAEKHGATILYKPCDVMRIFAETGGVPVPKRHPTRQAYRLQELPRIARRAGLPITISPAHWPTDPVPATTAILAAAEAGGGDPGAVARALLSACWAEEKDIADPDVVAKALAAGGFDAAALSPAMAAAQPRIAELTDEALAKGVFGAPFYVVGEELFWGQGPLAVSRRSSRGLTLMPQFEDQGLKIGYLEMGPEDAPLALFAHCSLAFSGLWKGVMSRLSDRWRCVALDMPGHGASDRGDRDLSLQMQAVRYVEAAAARWGGGPGASGRGFAGRGGDGTGRACPAGSHPHAHDD